MRENMKRAGYASARIANNVGTRDVYNSWDVRKREESETRIARDAKCATDAIYAKCEKCDVRDVSENAKCAKTRKARKRENAKIAKVVALLQVQYKVLLYGLYAPVETWVSTARGPE